MQFVQNGPKGTPRRGNAAAYEEYKAKVPTLISKHGGEYLARGARFVILEGDWKPSRVVLSQNGPHISQRVGPPRVLGEPEGVARP